MKKFSPLFILQAIVFLKDSIFASYVLDYTKAHSGVDQVTSDVTDD